MKFIFYLLFIFMAPNVFASLSGNKTPIGRIDLSISLEATSLESNIQIVQKKLTKNEVALSEAIKIAISSFKNDYDEGNQSPLDIILEKSFENYLEGLSSDRELTIFAKSELNGLLLSKGTSLILVNEKRTGEELGFNPSRNWVFELKIPSIRSFTFWCVVNKYGDEKPYTFGEN